MQEFLVLRIAMPYNDALQHIFGFKFSFGVCVRACVFVGKQLWNNINGFPYKFQTIVKIFVVFLSIYLNYKFWYAATIVNSETLVTSHDDDDDDAIPLMYLIILFVCVCVCVCWLQEI